MKTLSAISKQIAEASIDPDIRGPHLRADRVKEHLSQHKYPYCTGKYSDRIKEKTIESDKPVWYESRSDSEGPFKKLMTVGAYYPPLLRMERERIIKCWKHSQRKQTAEATQ